MASVYSTQFFAVLGGTSSYTFVVPTGQVAIVRDLDGYINNVLGGSFVLQNAAGGRIYGNLQIPGSSAVVMQWTGRQVYSAGQSIVCVLGGDPVDFALSGYLLDDA